MGENMRKKILCVKEIKRSNGKPKQDFPIINRTDVMEAILSNELDENSRLRLSNLYAEITYIEQIDLKYMSEIVVSNEEDLEAYNILQDYRKQQRLESN
jgi:hypothetical protein